MTAQPCHKLSHHEYLEWESLQELKSEYYAGEVFAQAGASSLHNHLAGNFFAILHSHLKGKPCRTFISDMKLHIAEADAFFYPDIMVTCDPRDRETSLYKQHPVLIAEILSDSTAEYDRTFKFACYRNIPELKDYLVISQDVYSIQHYHLNVSKEWVLFDYSKDDSFHLHSLALDITVADVYADADFVMTREEKFRRV